MNTGIVYATLAYVAWGLFPLYFRQVADVPSMEVVLHRTVWALVVVLGLLALRRQWTWVGVVARQPRVLGAFVLSAFLLSGNWLTYVWAVQNQHVVDASLGYFILPLVTSHWASFFCANAPAPGSGWLWRSPLQGCCGSQCRRGGCRGLRSCLRSASVSMGCCAKWRCWVRLRAWRWRH